MTYGWQGPSEWEIERAYRRAQGEFIPDPENGCFNITCCCLVPAVIFAIFMTIATVSAVVKFLAHT